MTHRLVNRTERLAAIERMLLQNRLGLRAVEIAEACGVDRRTIYRDLALLEETGVPIYQKEGRFFVNFSYYLAPVRLNANEAIALFLATRMFLHYTGQPNPYLIGALGKLTSALPDTLAAHVSAVADIVRNDPVDRGFVTVLDTMTRAWSERRRVKLWYSAPQNGGASAREFATYFIEPTPDGDLYAVGFDTTLRQVCALNLRQIKRVNPLPVQYEIPPVSELQHFLSNTWGIVSDGHQAPTSVVLIFSAEAAPRISGRVWHPSQQIQLLDDGRCKLSLYLSNWRDMTTWIRSWGAQVEVLEPRSFREEIAAEVLRAATTYHQARI